MCGIVLKNHSSRDTTAKARSVVVFFNMLPKQRARLKASMKKTDGRLLVLLRRVTRDGTMTTD